MGPDQKRQIIEAAEALYDNSLPYHNFDHVREVLAAAETLMQECEKESVSVDGRIVFLAILFHDAGYHEDHERKGFRTKESYSAYLAENVLSEFSISAEVIEKVKQAINATHQDGICRSTEDKIVKNSDLHGLSSEYTTFKAASLKLLQEHQMLNQQTVDWEVWKQMVANKLENFLQNNDFLTTNRFDEEGQTDFLDITRENIQRLLDDEVTTPV